jgi:peptidoglycan hydrolase-like protein with peptidoglycan-binding domain
VKQGAVLYTVNLRPVVIARGVVPAFRPLAVGASGADVAQLQTFLTDRGYYQSAADGQFGWLTDRAVRAWQKAMGLEQDGIIQQGDLIFVPSLPSRVSLDTDVIVRGEAVSGGEAVVKGLPPEPTFSVPVTEVQARQMPLGTRVEITGPEDELWEAFIVDQVPSADGATVTAVLQGLEGGSICGDACDQIPVSDGSLLRSRIVTVESVSGLVVPTAALRSDPSGGITVIDDEGVVHDVSIVASAKGMAVITGVERGTMVRVPADEG